MNMKRLTLLLGLVTVLAAVGCSGGSSDDATVNKDVPPAGTKPPAALSGSTDASQPAKMDTGP